MEPNTAGLGLDFTSYDELWSKKQGWGRYPLTQESPPEGTKIESLKRVDFDLQLFFTLTDDSVPFVFNLFLLKKITNYT